MTNSIVYDDTGNEIRLKNTCKSGGEGTIYEIEGDNSQCVKIFNSQKITTDPELYEKILTMVNNPPYDHDWINNKHRSLAWPNSILYDSPDKNKFIGFTMPLIDLNVYKEVHRYWDTDDRLKLFGGTFTWRHLFTTAYNIASAIAAVHEKGYCVGDLREANILAANDAFIALIDCDSFQIKDPTSGKIFYTRVGVDEYLPPELQNANFGINFDRYYSDLFGLGIIVFKLLMNGVHPYTAKGKLVEDAPTTKLKIMKGYFPYVSKYNDTLDIKPPSYAPPFEIISPDVQRLFIRCFVNGHQKPEERPTAREWFNALYREIQYSEIKSETLV